MSTAASPPRRALASEALATVAVAAAVVVAYGLLTRLVPWISFQDDMQSQQIGVSREIARAVQEGTWPLVSPLSWNGGALAGEYQYGVFSPFRVALDFVAWRLRAGPEATALLLVSANLAVLAAGAFRLGRAMGLSRAAGALVAFAASFNGWVLVWGADWYPSLTSLAWLPWVPWALARRGIARVVGAAVFTELAVAAGWPFTDAMIPLVVGWWLAREASAAGTGRIARVASGAGAVALGVALAAPALLCLRAFAPSTLRAEMHGLDWVRHVPWSALPALALPALRADWSGFDGGPRPSIELSSGGLVLGLVVAALVARRRAFVRAVRWELGLMAVSAALMLAPSLAPMRWSFRWLPLFHLALGLVAGQALDRLASDAANATGDREGSLARNPGVLAAVLTLAIGALALALRAADPTTAAAVLGGWVALFALVALGWRRAPGQRAAWLAPVVTLLAQGIAMGAVDHPDNPQWAVDARALSPWPFHADRLYLGLTTLDALEGDDLDATLRPGDVPMLAGLSFVNGYSAMKPRGVQARFGSSVQGYLWPDAIARALDEATRDDGLLARLGVDGLVVGRTVEQVPQLAVNARLAGAGWTRVASLEAGSIWERVGPAHAVAWSPSLAVTPVSVGRDRIELDVSGDDGSSGAEIVTRRAWYPGWAATLGGVLVPVEAYEGIVAAVRLPPGAHGRLVMRYRPRGLREGAAIAAVALLLIAVLAVAERRRERA
ncbi:MAG TPA: hypothetical protein VMI75_35735 [Polyangiaceae bacterium]|nr:hypothetical protein [Polyangiaceae bacterium]